MKIILVLLFSLICTNSYATLNATYVPNVKSSGPPATIQNGDIVDTGTPTTSGSVGIGSTSPNGELDVEGTLQNTVFYAQTGQNFPNRNVGIGTFTPNGTLDVEGTVSPIVLNGLANSKNNIGIGSFSPGSLLDVNGSMRLVPMKASSGERYLCINSVGTVVAKPTACVGT